MNVTVTMLQSGRTDDWGRPLVAGSSYSLDFDRAKSLWQAGFASVADPAIFEDDNTPFDGGFIKYMRFPGFRKSLLASLVASSTASRTNDLVTVTATAHGVTTGVTYQGYRFFYPGSASLAAGWYDSIVEIATANTLSFSAPGADFGSESVNGAAAYTTLTSFASIEIPGNYLAPGSQLTIKTLRGGDTTASTKAIRGLLGSQFFGLSNATTGPNGVIKMSLCVEGPVSASVARITSPSGVDGSLWNSVTSNNFDLRAAQTLAVQGSVSAAGGFLVIPNLLLEIVR